MNCPEMGVYNMEVTTGWGGQGWGRGGDMVSMDM